MPGAAYALKTTKPRSLEPSPKVQKTLLTGPTLAAALSCMGTPAVPAYGPPAVTNGTCASADFVWKATAPTVTARTARPAITRVRTRFMTGVASVLCLIRASSTGPPARHDHRARPPTHDGERSPRHDRHATPTLRPGRPRPSGRNATGLPDADAAGGAQPPSASSFARKCCRAS